MNKYEEVTTARYSKLIKDQQISEVLRRTLENIAAERAGEPAPYDDIKIYEQVKKIKNQINESVSVISDEAALIAPELFEEWNGRGYSKGERVTENGILYKAKDNIESNSTWKPSVTPTLWEPVALPEEDGTIDNPITAVIGMNYYKDLYYKQDGKLYLCTRQDTTNGTALYHPLSLLVNLYFEEVTS